MKKYLAIAYYKIISIKDPHKEVQKHKIFFKDKDIKGRIYIANQGINGQISATEQAFLQYQDWLESQSYYSDMSFKNQEVSLHIFDRITVKYKEQLVAVDVPVDFSKRAQHISPEDWKKALEKNDENVLILDVRNQYEGKIGHFENAVVLPLETFRQFPEYIKTLKKQYDPKKTKVLMYCTGGIRCEFFSPLMVEAGFTNIAQLEGGVIAYGQKQGNKHWKGKLFVFDDRLATNISEEEKAPISCCNHCEKKSDRYVNCANMDCNQLFLICDDCLEKYQGLCSVNCEKGRLRPFKHAHYPKPFRRQTFAEKQALKAGSAHS